MGTKKTQQGFIKKGTVRIYGIEIYQVEVLGVVYLNLNDIAAHSDGQRYHIDAWLRDERTLAFLAAWEKQENPDFDVEGYFGYLTSLNKGVVSTASRWVRTVDARGIVVIGGSDKDVVRGGLRSNVYAHPDIADEFMLYLGIGVDKEASELNTLFEDSIDIYGEMQSLQYQVLEKAVFGKTNREWEQENPDALGCQLDYITLLDRVVFDTLEPYNALLFKKGLSAKKRYDELVEMAKHFRRVYADDRHAEKLLVKYTEQRKR